MQVKDFLCAVTDWDWCDGIMGRLGNDSDFIKGSYITSVDCESRPDAVILVSEFAGAFFSIPRWYEDSPKWMESMEKSVDFDALVSALSACSGDRLIVARLCVFNSDLDQGEWYDVEALGLFYTNDGSFIFDGHAEKAPRLANGYREEK